VSSLISDLCPQISAFYFLISVLALAAAPCATPAATPDQTGSIIQVTFWNIRDFSVTSRDDTELGLIAQIAIPTTSSPSPS
jgi:hypothetical protein